MDILSNFNLILMGLAVFIFSTFLSLIAFNLWLKTSIWFSVKASQLKISSLGLGIFVVLSSSIFLFAFLNSGALIFMSAFPVFIISFLSVVTFIFLPISFGAMIQKYIFKRENFTDSRNIFYANTYILTLFILPFYIGLIFYFILFLYIFGIVAKTSWDYLLNNN